ncbi:MAG TPA: sulfocyanin-like copper-binding protein [Gemmatimonadales bacterium]|nr:sulfocyanin-like copper-binding protein [Gemmatimonadales bacterium]
MTFRILGGLGLLLIAAPVAGQATPTPRPDPAWMTVDSAQRSVTFELIAGMTTANGSLNFNGQKGGALTFVVPWGWRVTLDFVNRDKNLPHSAQVISGQGAVPMGPGTPAFPGASSSEPATGVPATAPMEPIRFVAATAGEYRIFCAVPGHGMAGMWVSLKVDPSATLPSVTIH